MREIPFRVSRFLRGLSHSIYTLLAGSDARIDSDFRNGVAIAVEECNAGGGTLGSVKFNGKENVSQSPLVVWVTVH